MPIDQTRRNAARKRVRQHITPETKGRLQLAAKKLPAAVAARRAKFKKIPAVGRKQIIPKRPSRPITSPKRPSVSVIARKIATPEQRARLQPKLNIIKRRLKSRTLRLKSRTLRSKSRSNFKSLEALQKRLRRA